MFRFESPEVEPRPAGRLLTLPDPIDAGVRLSTLRSGARGRILRILQDSGGRADRLLTLGVIPGVDITVLQTFPGVIFRCDETELAVEPEVARAIIVQPL